MTGAARIALLAGGSGLAVLAATQWLGGNAGTPDDVGRVEIRDVLVARGAQVHAGRLHGCEATSCELNDRRFARDALSFIGLGVEAATPPAVEDPAQDELHLRGGGVVHERLARIDGQAVFAGARRFERAEVAWVYLAPEPEEPSGPVTSAEPPSEPEDEAEQPPPPPPPPSDPEPEPGEESLPEPRDPPEEAFQGCPDDRPLGAWIWLRNDYQDFRPPNCRGSETQVVRFRLEADPGTQLTGSPVARAYSAREIRYSVSTNGCFDVDDGDYRTCNAEGTFAEGTLPLSVDNLGYAQFFPLDPQLGFQYPTPPTTPFELTVRCLHHPTGVASDNTVNGMNGISISPGECAYPGRECNDYCVAPTVCKDPTGAPQDCYLKPERFAVIPFEGALVDGPEREERGLCVTPGSSQVRWRVCCGCAETGPPPDFTPRRDDCGPPEPQRALLDTAMEQQKAILRPLGEMLREQQRIQQQARQWQGDFEHATRDCQLWSVARALVGLLASGGAPGVGTGALRGAQPVAQTKEFWNFLAMAEKVSASDPSWLLPNHEFGDWASVEDAWDGFTIAYGALGPSSPQSLREGLQQCGAPTLEGVLDGAYEYLRLLEQLPALAERISRLLNDSRAKDQEIFDLWQKWLQACREYERCRGGDPSRCDEPTHPDAPRGGAP